MVNDIKKVLDNFSSLSNYFSQMQYALRLAKWGGKLGEIPLGAIIYNSNNKLISVGQNKVERNKDVTAHAEIIAIQRASKKLKTKYLDDHCLISTLEPCSMCASAIREARIPLLVFGAEDKKGGAVNNTCKLYNLQSIKPSPIVISSILEYECSQILKVFFQKLRLAK